MLATVSVTDWNTESTTILSEKITEIMESMGVTGIWTLQNTQLGMILTREQSCSIVINNDGGELYNNGDSIVIKRTAHRLDTLRTLLAAW